jgi:hypothetical protein
VTRCWFIIHVEDSANMQNGCVFFSIEATVEKKVNDVIYIVRTNKTHQRRVAHVDKLKLICCAALRANDSGQNMAND